MTWTTEEVIDRFNQAFGVRVVDGRIVEAAGYSRTGRSSTPGTADDR